MRFTRPKSAECMILGLPASVNYQIGLPSFPGDGPGSVLLSRPTEGDDFEVELPIEVLERILDEWGRM